MISFNVNMVVRGHIPFHEPTRRRVHSQVKLAFMTQNIHLKTKPQTRLSILILSKAYPTSGIYLADS
jgi:hypothetical protein